MRINFTRKKGLFIVQINNDKEEFGCSGEYKKFRIAAIASALLHYLKFATEIRKGGRL